MVLDLVVISCMFSSLFPVLVVLSFIISFFFCLCVICVVLLQLRLSAPPRLVSPAPS